MALLSLSLLLFFLLHERPDSGERFAVPDDDGILTRETRVHPRSPLAPAVEAYRQGYHRKAIGLLRELIKKKELRKAERLKAGNYLGYLYLARQKRAEAAVVFRETLQTDSGNVPALHGLGLIAQLEGDHKAALRHFQDALDNDPQSVRSRFHLGQSQFALGRYGEAAASYTLALAGRDDPRIRYELGMALLRQGRAAAAWTEFKRVLDFSPNRVLLGYASARLGDIADDRQDRVEAIQHYRLAVRYYPAKFEFSFNLGVLLLKHGERDEALTVFRGILPTAPDGRVAALARTLGEIHYVRTVRPGAPLFPHLAGPAGGSGYGGGSRRSALFAQRI
jgi:tetratricopeptide (TPR) repeat protein